MAKQRKKTLFISFLDPNENADWLDVLGEILLQKIDFLNEGDKFGD